MSWRTLPRYTLSTAVSVPGVTSLSSGPTSMRPAWSSSSTVGVVHQLRARADYGVDAATGDRMQVECATTSDRARDRPRWWSNRRNLVTLPPSYATHLHRYPGGHRPDVPGSSQRTGFRRVSHVGPSGRRVKEDPHMTFSPSHLNGRQRWRRTVIIATLLLALTPVAAAAMPTADNPSGGG